MIQSPTIDEPCWNSVDMMGDGWRVTRNGASSPPFITLPESESNGVPGSKPIRRRLCAENVAKPSMQNVPRLPGTGGCLAKSPAHPLGKG